MNDATGSTPREKYGISRLPDIAREPAQGKTYVYCERCHHNVHAHKIIGTWACNHCECEEFESEVLTQHLAERAKNKKFGRSLPPPLRREVVARDGMICYYCGHRLHTRRTGPHKLHFDHLTPFSRGGKHTLENLVASCMDCNLAKHDMGEREFWEARRKWRLGCHRKVRESAQKVAHPPDTDPPPSAPTHTREPRESAERAPHQRS